jgi:hypothetical protein
MLNNNLEDLYHLKAHCDEEIDHRRKVIEEAKALAAQEDGRSIILRKGSYYLDRFKHWIVRKWL